MKLKCRTYCSSHHYYFIEMPIVLVYVYMYVIMLAKCCMHTHASTCPSECATVLQEL